MPEAPHPHPSKEIVRKTVDRTQQSPQGKQAIARRGIWRKFADKLRLRASQDPDATISALGGGAKTSDTQPIDKSHLSDKSAEHLRLVEARRVDMEVVTNGEELDQALLKLKADEIPGFKIDGSKLQLDEGEDYASMTPEQKVEAVRKFIIRHLQAQDDSRVIKSHKEAANVRVRGTKNDLGWHRDSSSLAFLLQDGEGLVNIHTTTEGEFKATFANPGEDESLTTLKYTDLGKAILEGLVEEKVDTRFISPTWHEETGGVGDVFVFKSAAKNKPGHSAWHMFETNTKTKYRNSPAQLVGPV